MPAEYRDTDIRTPGTPGQAGPQGEASGGRREALQALGLLGLMTLPRPTAAAAGTSSGNATAEQLHADISAVLQQTAEIWNSQHFYRLKDVWDADDPAPWYVPEEIQEPFRTWPEIEKYWGPPRRVLKAFRWRFDQLHVKALAPDLTLALFDHYYELELGVGPPQPPTAGFDRCLALFRRKPEGWRHILYAQCPLGPDTYLRTLRQKIVPEDFGAYRDDVERRYRERHSGSLPAVPETYRPKSP
jgi:hypothetical protein